MIVYTCFCYLTSPNTKYSPTWSNSSIQIDQDLNYVFNVFNSFQSPHNGDDLSEGEGDVGSPDDEMGQKVNKLFYILVCVICES